MKNKSLKIILTVVATILLIPFIAMQFTDEVSWTILDFLVMGILLLGTGLLFELVMRKMTNVKYRTFLLVAIILTFLLVWAELAVGIFGTPFAGS